jgi:hypothetical protein
MMRHLLMLFSFGLVPFLIGLTLVVGLSQEVLPRTLDTPSGGSDVFSHASGTLNLVLANKHGVVIAADSRGTWKDSHGTVVRREDNIQKLFRTGNRSALVIAGLLAYSPYPYSLETSSRLLGGFGREGLPGNLGDPDFVIDSIQSDLGPQLSRLSAILSTYDEINPGDLRLIATIAGYDKAGSLQVRQITFSRENAPVLANGKNIWLVDSSMSQKKTVTGFDKFTAGMPEIAEAILAGQYATSDPAVLKYFGALREGKRDELSLESLQSLAEAIFRETIKHEPGVGGDVQIAMIPADGKPIWRLKPTQKSTTLLGGALLIVGGHNPFVDPQWMKGAHVEMAQSFDSLNVDAVFVGTRFEDLTIPLDENHYFGNTFRQCTFLYSGAPLVKFGKNNKTIDCRLEIKAGLKTLPSEVRELKSRCPRPDRSEKARKLLPKFAWKGTPINGGSLLR